MDMKRGKTSRTDGGKAEDERKKQQNIIPFYLERVFCINFHCSRTCEAAASALNALEGLRRVRAASVCFGPNEECEHRN